jgi:uncharacterized protein YbjQ (UPF0145 family)
MNKFALSLGVVLAVFSPVPAAARDTVLHLPLADVLLMPEASSSLDGTVKFFLAGAEHPEVSAQLGSGVSNRKTNGVGHSDKEACKWAALSALIAFQESAKQKGANAVVNLISYYKKVEYTSSTEYECHAGGVVVGVALKGEYARVD